MGKFNAVRFAGGAFFYAKQLTVARIKQQLRWKKSFVL